MVQGNRDGSELGQGHQAEGERSIGPGQKGNPVSFLIPCPDK
jgi:hypothetical protein